MQCIFDKNVLQKANLEFIHKGWTFGFVEDKNLNQTTVENNQSLYMRLKELIDCQIQTQDLDLFMRLLKQFYINNYKKLY